MESAVFVRKNVGYGYDVRKFTADTILFREIQSKKRDVLAFSGQNKVNHSRVTITRLFHCITTC